MTELVNISAKTLSGQVYTVQIENSKKIYDLKDKFSEETKQSLKDFEYKIIFKGAVLKDDEIISDKDLGGKTVVIMIKTKPVDIPTPKTPPIIPLPVNIQTIPNIPLHINTGNIPHIMEPFPTMPNIIQQINNLMQVPTIPVAGPSEPIPPAQPIAENPNAEPEQMMMNNFQTMVNNMINSENNATNMHTALVNQMLQQITQTFGPNTTLQSLLSTGLNGQINVPEELDEHHDDEEDGEDEEYKEGENDEEDNDNHEEDEEENHENDYDEEDHHEEDHNIDEHEDEHEEHNDEVNYDLHDDYPEHNQEIANFDKELLKFNLSEKDMKEIEMVATMGYDINEVIEIYLVCNKDINLTLDNLSLS